MSLVSKGVERSREEVAFKVDDALTKTQPWGSAGGVLEALWGGG